MRICLVAFQFWPSIGGSQAQAEKQARYLQYMGQEVLIVTLRHQKTWPSTEVYMTIPVIRVGGLYRSDGTLRTGRAGQLVISALFFVTLWRLRRRYDLLHTMQISPLALVAALVGRLTHKPVLVGVQSTGPCEPLASSPRQEMLASVDQQTTASLSPHLQDTIGGDLANLERTTWGGSWMLRQLRKSSVYYHILSSRSYVYLIQHGFRPERIVYLPNGVNTQQFFPGRRQLERTFEQERRMLCVARLEYAKGIDVLLAAWAYLLRMPDGWRKNLHLRLCLVGDGACRQELEAQALALGIQQSVEFLGTRHDIPALMQQAWGFVLPSRWEGMPNALLEAMACGLPTIATRVSGSEDVIEQGINGLLVEPEQPELLAYALRLLIDDASMAKKLGQQGYETVMHYYQIQTTVRSCLTFYQYLLSGRRMSDLTSKQNMGAPGVSPEEWQRYER
jgi:glycosyltransferase involved in cell wall biosynthesis